MMQLYKLSICDTTADPPQMFLIGVFSSLEKSKEIAETMLKEVPGFQDYPCRYEIDEKSVEGSEITKVCQIWGWDEDESFEPVRIIESGFYLNRAEAEAELRRLQEKYTRQEWCIDEYEIDEVHWKEGFVKV